MRGIRDDMDGIEQDSTMNFCSGQEKKRPVGPETGVNRGKSLSRYLISIMISALLVLFSTCNKSDLDPSLDKNRVAVTILPLESIVRNLVGESGEVRSLVPPGFSPVLYEIGPADIEYVSRARLVFHINDPMDGWVKELPIRNRVAVLDLLPASFRLSPLPVDGDEKKAGHNEHGNVDPHFWLDPGAVIALLPGLTKVLCANTEISCSTLEKNRISYTARLQALDRELEIMMLPVKGKGLVLFHPSFQYFARRYGLKIVGVLEPSPGVESGPLYLSRQATLIQKKGVRAIFSEPQLPSRPARVVAEAARVDLFELDPLGGKESESLEELLRRDAKTILEALQ